MELSPTRSYRMSARADSAAETGDRILDSAVRLFWEGAPLSLESVADSADVSVRTVIRRFGSKDGLMRAAIARESARTRSQRDEAPIGDVPGALAVLVEHYENMGDRVLTLLAQEGRLDGLDEIVESGRRLHRDWCARVFAPTLHRLHGVERRRRRAQLVAICDVYTWKLLRRDAGLSRSQTETALVELLTPMLGEP